MAKRIFVATSGSRGDVEPFLALSKACKNAGYDVVLSAPPDFGEWIAAHGIAHHSAGGPARDIVNAFAEAIENDRFFRSLAWAVTSRNSARFSKALPKRAKAPIFLSIRL